MVRAWDTGEKKKRIWGFGWEIWKKEKPSEDLGMDGMTIKMDNVERAWEGGVAFFDLRAGNHSGLLWT